VLPGAVREWARVGPGLIIVPWMHCHCPTVVTGRGETRASCPHKADITVDNSQVNAVDEAGGS
jgi:hypothetical protein